MDADQVEELLMFEHLSPIFRRASLLLVVEVAQRGRSVLRLSMVRVETVVVALVDLVDNHQAARRKKEALALIVLQGLLDRVARAAKLEGTTILRAGEEGEGIMEVQDMLRPS